MCALLLVSSMGLVSASAGAASGVTASVSHGVLASAPDQQGGTGDPAPVDPQQVRDDVRDVLERAEFDYSPSVLERFFEWIGEQLSKLFQPGDGAGAGASFGGGIGALIGWLLIVAAVVAILVVAFWVISNRTRRSRPTHDDPLSPVEIEHRRRADEWMSDAERWESSGEWKEALRARYRNLVRVLVDRRQLPDVPGRTTGELRSDLDSTTPDARDAFDTCCLLFELAWYANVATGPEENRRFHASADQVHAAAAIDRFDPSTLFDVAGVARECDESMVPVAAASGDGADGGSGS